MKYLFAAFIAVVFFVTGCTSDMDKNKNYENIKNDMTDVKEDMKDGMESIGEDMKDSMDKMKDGIKTTDVNDLSDADDINGKDSYNNADTP